MAKTSSRSTPVADKAEFPVYKKGELQVSLRAITDLVPAARNARTHSEAQVDVICASLKEFGWTNPVLISGKNGIVAGHGRVLAARKLGMTEVPVIELAHLSAAQRRAYLIADNQTALRAGWDLAALKLELTELQAGGFDLAPLGFDPIELGALLGTGANVGLTDPDAVPDAPEIPVAATGDLWALGRHWLLCGDATKAEDVERLLGGQRADIIVTDPPYGVGFERGKFVGRDKAAKGPGYAPIANDELKGEKLTAFIASALKQGFAVAKDAPIYCWSPPLSEGGAILAGVQSAGFKVQSQIIWRKTPFVIGRADYHWQHEVCWYGFKGKGHPWYGGRNKGTVWDCPKPHKVDLHPTMKPVQLYSMAIENSSKGGDIALDLFAGAGPLAIACEQAGRVAYMMEMEPVYCDVIVKRWQDFTGQVATLEGISFAEIEKKRQKRAA